MTVWIDNKTSNKIFENYEEILKNTVILSLEEEKYPKNMEVSISIVNNSEIQEINKQFRNIDKPTDVLSFPMIEFDNNLNPKNLTQNINIDTKEIILGDIIISIEKALEQANEFGHNIQREVAFLTAHSMFHLMGYDHETIEDEKIMKQKQESILLKLGLPR